MKPKQLIPFIIILLVLGGLVMFKQSKTEKPSIVKQANLESLVPESIKKDAVTRVELYAGSANTERVVLTKEGDAWAVTSNFNAPVTKDTIDKYLDMLLALKGERRDTAMEDSKLASYELKDDQAFHVELFTGAETAAFHLLVGKAPDSRSVFLRTADAKDIYVEGKDPRKEAGVTTAGAGAGATPGAEVKPTATHWFDKDIIKIEQDRIKKVALTMPDKSLVLERVEVPAEAPATPPADPAAPAATTPAPEAAPTEPTTTWQLASGGPGIPLKVPGVDSILQKIATFVATDIVDPAKKADWGLETPAFKAEITLEGDETIVLEAGRPDPAGDAYVRLASKDKDIVYQVNKMNFERLFAKGNQLFDLPKQPLAEEAIEGIQISGPEGEIILKKEGEWKLVSPATELELQIASVTSLVSTLANLAPADYADEATDIGAVTHTITVSAAGQNVVIRIAGKSKSSDGNYVQIGDGLVKLALSANDIAKLAIKPRDIFNRKIFDVPVANTTSVDVTHDGAVFTLAKNGETWIKTAADGTSTPIETKLVEDFLFGLDELQIDNLQADVDPASLKIDTSVKVNYSEGDPLSVNVSTVQKDGYMLYSNAHAGVFSIELASMAPFIGPLISMLEAKAPTSVPEAAPAASEVPPMLSVPQISVAPETPVSPEPAAETPSVQAPAPVVIQNPAPESAPAN